MLSQQKNLFVVVRFFRLGSRLIVFFIRISISENWVYSWFSSHPHVPSINYPSHRAKRKRHRRKTFSVSSRGGFLLKEAISWFFFFEASAMKENWRTTAPINSVSCERERRGTEVVGKILFLDTDETVVNLPS